MRRLHSSSIRARNVISGLLAVSCWTATLILAAAAETAPPSSKRADAASAAWGATGSAPQTGSSAHTSGTAFKALVPGTPPEQSAKPAEPFPAKILVVIDKPTQEMKVFVGNTELYTWKVSTGLRSYDTPSGNYAARSMNEIWYSREWDDAPMPHAIFFTKKGHAIHGTEDTQRLGRPASHGCVRLAPENARTLFALVKEIGLKHTEIVLNGDLPKEVVKAPPAKKPAKTALKKKPTSKQGLAQSGSRTQKATAKQQKAAKQPSRPPKKFVDPRFDPYAIGAPRGLSRREWRRLYSSGMLPPPGYAPRALRRY